MAPYLILLFCTAGAGFFLCERTRSRKMDFWFLAGAGLLLVVLAAIRAQSVGVDSKMYAEYFQSVHNDGISFLLSDDPGNYYKTELGFPTLTYLISRFTGNAQVFLAIVSALIISLRMAFIWRESPSAWISVCVYISFGFFGYAMCTLRQELGISVAMFALPFLKQKKLLPYFLIILLAGFFHMSLWILIPVYFVARWPLDWRLLLLYAAGALTVLLLSDMVLTLIATNIEKYSIYMPGTIYTRGRDYNTFAFPMMLAVLAVLLHKLVLKRNPENIVYINFSIYAALLFFLTLKNFIFQRVGLLFLPIALVLLPEILAGIYPDPEKYSLLEEYQRMNHQKKKQMQSKYTDLKRRRTNDMILYYTSLFLVLGVSALYFLFLLSGNRLLLVPYTTIFAG